MSNAIAECNLLPVVSYVLERIVAQNEQSRPSSELSVYHAVKAPSISLQEYLQRIVRYLKCGNQLLVSSLIYIDLAVQRSRISITSLCVHRVLLTSVLLAIKFHDDHFYTNAYMAKVGGVTTKEMNRLELDFLKRVDFRLSIKQSVYECYCAELARHAAAFQSAAASLPTRVLASPVPAEASAPRPPSPASRGAFSSPVYQAQQQQFVQQSHAQPQQLHHHLASHHQASVPAFQASGVYYAHPTVHPAPEAHSVAEQVFYPPAASHFGGATHHYFPVVAAKAKPLSATSSAFYPASYQQQQQQQPQLPSMPPTQHPYYAPHTQGYYAMAAPFPHEASSFHDSATENFAVSASQLRAACEACVSQEVYRKHLSPSLVGRAVVILDEEQRKNPLSYDGALSSHVLHDTCARLVQEQHLSPSLIRRANATLRSVVCGY